MAFSCLEFLWFTAIPSTPSHSAKPFCSVSKDTGLVSKSIDTSRLSQCSEFPPSGLGLWPEPTPCSQMCQKEPRPSGRSTAFSACGVAGGAVMWWLFPSPKSQGDSGWGWKICSLFLWAPPEREVLGYEACKEFLFSALWVLFMNPPFSLITGAFENRNSSGSSWNQEEPLSPLPTKGSC